METASNSSKPADQLQISGSRWPLLHQMGGLAKMGVLFVLGVLLGAAVSQYLISPESLFTSIASLAPQTQQISFYSTSQSTSSTRPPPAQDWLLQGAPSIHHNMSDDHLLWLASFMAPRRPGNLPIPRVPKLAFMFLTRGPLPLAPLWEAFFKGHEGLYSIYVHTHPGYKPRFPASSPFYDRQVPSKRVFWADATMGDAERRLLANALLDFGNERFILLSEACIPLYPFPIVYDYLVHSEVSFVESYDDPAPGTRARYNKNMVSLFDIEQWRKGSQWFDINRKLAIYIVSDSLYYPIFRNYCRPIDEHYLPTVLSIEFGSQIANRSVTWVDWSNHGAHPAMFSKKDITKDLIHTMRGTSNCTYNGQLKDICFLFARKLSPDTLDPLLQHASELIGI